MRSPWESPACTLFTPTAEHGGLQAKRALVALCCLCLGARLGPETTASRALIKEIPNPSLPQLPGFASFGARAAMVTQHTPSSKEEKGISKPGQNQTCAAPRFLPKTGKAPLQHLPAAGHRHREPWAEVIRHIHRLEHWGLCGAGFKKNTLKKA